MGVVVRRVRAAILGGYRIEKNGVVREDASSFYVGMERSRERFRVDLEVYDVDVTW